MKEIEVENQRLRKAVDLTLDTLILREAARGPERAASAKLLSPARQHACIAHVIDVLHVCERSACRALGQHRSTQRKVLPGKDGEAALTADLLELAKQYGRYGYREISALLNTAGWLVDDKRA